MRAIEEDSLPVLFGRQRIRSRILTGFTVLALVLCVGLVGGLGWMVQAEIDELGRATSDNLQWTLSKTEVEYVRMQEAFRDGAEGRPDTTEIRRRFDIVYSRISTLEVSPAFAPLRDDPGMAGKLAEIRSFLDDTVGLIDGPDDALVAALPGLQPRIDALEANIREIGLTGLRIFAEISDNRRAELVHGFIVAGAVLGLVLCALVLIAGMLLGMARTAEHRTREMMRTATRLRTIVETSLDGIFVADPAGTIIEFNPAAQAIFGYSRNEARGNNAGDLLFPPEVTADLRGGRLAYLNERRRPEPHERVIELTAVDCNGRRFPAEFSVDRADQDDGHVFVAIIRDITRRKAAEEGLTQARDRALAGERAKAEFLAVMSHEMRTPLNGLLGTMDLLHDHALSERQAALLARMQSSGRSLLALVNDVLELAKFEAGKMQAEARAFSVPRLADGVIETAAPMATANENTLNWAWVGAPVETVMADSRRLRQILLNLVGNAVKFTRGGSVDLEIEALGARRDMLEFRVIDTGIGIDPDHAERIFEDFETLDSSYAREVGGTGLGLGIARRLAGMLGGEIGVESEPGEGSLFWLRIPIEHVDSPAEAEPVIGGPRKTRGRLNRPLDLLLVEDNEINRFVAREMLEAEGHKVTEAVNGRAGVEWAASRCFDAILMDISMPEMDGPEAARLIRSGDGPSARVPIIAVTAHALPEEIARFHEAGMDACISKPLDRELLLDTLVQVVSGGTVRAPAPPEPPRPVDLSRLDELRERLRPEAFSALLERFVTETRGTVAALASGQVAPEELAATAHRIAGSCATFGFDALRSALARIETEAKAGRTVSPGDLAALTGLWDESHALLIAREDLAASETGRARSAAL
nr:PAS domain-containing hybrid sensor histidine kinase/response regulator [Mangrovicoccus algicola]